VLFIRLATFAVMARLRVDPSSSTDGLQHNYEREDNEEKFVTKVGTQHSYDSRTQQHEGKAYREEDKFHVEPQSYDWRQMSLN
jgi:hypothetical protein